jgi:periplasmic protein TonB
MIEGIPVSAEKAEALAEAWPRLESGDIAFGHGPDSTAPSQHDLPEGAIPLPDSIVPGATRVGAGLRPPRLGKGWPGATGSLLAHIAVVTALLIFSPWSDTGFVGDEDEITIELVEALPQEQVVSSRESAAPPTAAEPQPTPVEARPDTPSPASPEVKEEQPPTEPPPPEQTATAEPQPDQPAPVVGPPTQPPPPEQTATAEPQPDQPAPVVVPPPEPPAAAAPAEEPSAVPPPAPMPPPPAPTLPPPPVKVERPQPPATRPPPIRPPEQVAREKAEAAARERAAQVKREQEAKAARERSAQAKREEAVNTAALEAQERAEASAKTQANQAAAQAYRGAVVGHLAAYKHYPPGARARGAQGNPVVAFSLDAAGRVVGVSLTRGSGDAEIDAEVVAMVRRASPFPAPPPGAPRAFSAPINFRLQ